MKKFTQYIDTFLGNTRQRHILLFVVILTSMLAQLGLIVKDPKWGGDGPHYHSLAKNLVANGTFELPASQHNRFRAMPENNEIQAELYRSPLYPALVAVAYALFGAGLQQALLCNILFFLLALFCVYKTSVLVGNPKVATIATILLALNPYMISQTSTLMTEPLFALNVSLILWMLIRFYKLSTSKNAIFIGLSFALAVHCRPTIMAFFGLFYLYRLTLKRREGLWRKELLAIFVFVMAATPWAIRNSVASGGHLIPFSSSLGYNFWIGNSHHNLNLYRASSRKEYILIDDMFWAESKKRGELFPAYDDYQWDNYWKKEAIKEVLANPKQTLILYYYKLKHFFTPYVNPYLYSLFPFLISLISSLVMFGLSIYFFVLEWKRGWPNAFSPAGIILIVAFAIIHTITLCTIRYRVPVMEPTLAIFGGLALAGLMDLKVYKSS